MAEINIVLDEIHLLREKLENLIRIKGNLLDPEVIKASVSLDDALNSYNELKDSNSANILRVS